MLGYTIAALTAVPGATLLLVPRFLSDDGFRKRMVEAFVTDPAVRSYWHDFDKRSPRERREMCGSVLNKANELLREPVLRNILGQSPNKLDIRSIIEHRGILIVNLAKSEIGTEYARLIGAFIVSQIALAAAARMQALSRCLSDDPERALSAFPDFYTFVDEFQDLATAKFDHTLISTSVANASRSICVASRSSIPNSTIPPLLCRPSATARKYSIMRSSLAASARNTRSTDPNASLSVSSLSLSPRVTTGTIT